MTTVDTRISQVAIYGRAADELTRADLNPRQFQARLIDHPRRAVQKDDGYFVFADLPATPPNYLVELSGRQYQTRRFTVAAPGGSSVQEIDPDGEDELHVVVTGITANRAEFAMLPFMPSIAEDSQVLGEGGFLTTLDETLEGVDTDGAELFSVAGLGTDQILRIVRSTRVLLRPGPYYAFLRSTTVVAIRVVEPMLDAAPIEDVQIEITGVNGAAVTSVVVAGVQLFRADLPLAGPATLPFMIGTQDALVTFTNWRGDAVFYYTPTTPVTSLALSISKTGYVTQTPTVAVQPGQRVFNRIQLVRS